MGKLKPLRAGEEITEQHELRQTQRINEHDITVVGPGLSKVTSQRGTTIIFNPPPFSGAIPGPISYGSVLSGWELDNPWDYVNVAPCDALGAYTSGVAWSGWNHISGSGSGWDGGLSGIVRVYLESPFNGPRSSGYLTVNNWYWQLESGVVIAYIPVNSGNYTYQSDPDTFSWLSGNLIGWALPIQKVHQWGQLSTDWISGNNYVYVTPQAYPDGDPIPYTTNNGYGVGVIKCWLATPYTLPGTGTAYPVGSYDASGSPTPLVAGDIISIEPWARYSSGAHHEIQCWADSLLWAGTGSGSAGTKHPLLDHNYDIDTTNSPPTLGDIVYADIGASGSSGASRALWTPLAIGAYPSVMIVSGEIGDAVPYWLKHPSSDITNRLLEINKTGGTVTPGIDWTPAGLSGGQVLYIKGIGLAAEIDWTITPPGPNAMLYSVAGGDLNWSPSGSSGQIFTVDITGNLNWIGAPGHNEILYGNSLDIPQWSPSGTTGHIFYIDASDNPGWIAAPSQNKVLIGSSSIPVWSPSGTTGQIFYVNASNAIGWLPEPADNNVLIASGSTNTVPYWLPNGATSTDPAVLIQDLGAGDSTRLTHWSKPTAANQILYRSGYPGAITWTVSPTISGQVFMFDGTNIVWMSGTPITFVEDVTFDHTSGILYKYISSGTIFNYVKYTSGTVVDVAIYCSGS